MKRPLLAKFLVAGALVLPALAYLGYAAAKDGGLVQYHLKVDAYVADAKFHSQRVRLAGHVAEQGLVIGAGRLNATFTLKGENSSVPVSYRGVVPDLFKAGCEVLVEGKMSKDGVFQAELVMTKCASKYEAAGHGKPAEKRS